MRKQYLSTPKVIRAESAAAGKKRVWIEVAEGEAIMLKLSGTAKQSDVDAEAAAALARLIEAQEKKEELEALRQQVAALEQELGL